MLVSSLSLLVSYRQSSACGPIEACDLRLAVVTPWSPWGGHVRHIPTTSRLTQSTPNPRTYRPFTYPATMDPMNAAWPAGQYAVALIVRRHVRPHP